MNNPLVQLDPGLYIWTIVVFLILLGLLARFAPPCKVKTVSATSPAAQR